MAAISQPAPRRSLRKRLSDFRAEYGRALLLLSPALLLLLLLAASIALLVVYSFYTYQQGGGMQPDFTLNNYIHLIERPLYSRVIVNTLRYALVVTVLNFLIGYPLAYYLKRLSPGLRTLGFMLLILPLWTSVVVRTYGWAILLGRRGVVNVLLEQLGLGPSALDIYPGFWAAIIGLLEITLPLMVLPIYTNLLNIEPSVEEASLTLGANPLYTFLRVTLPLSLPGVFAGVILTFVLTLSAYITPVLLGGPREQVLPVLIEGQVNGAYNIPFASALALVMLVIVSIVVVLFRRFVRLDQLFG